LLNRRAWLASALGATASLAFGGSSLAAQSPAFARWVANFRSRAIRRGISEATYDRVMNALTPDTSVYELQRAQPEFTEQVWQYINRRCSDWRVITGKERGIVSAASYEAKARGVTRGMTLSEVRRVCPDAIILPSDY
jgi:membrane-bound lytic murein transglycosylase B